MPKQYSISSYDKNVCLKINAMMWLIFMFILKPYVIALFTVLNTIFSATSSSSNMGQLMNMFYPDKGTMLLNIIAGIPVIFLLYAWLRRKPESPKYIKFIWSSGRNLIAISVILNVCIIISPQLFGAVSNIMTSAWVQLFINVIIVIILYSSSYTKDCFADFPRG